MDIAVEKRGPVDVLSMSGKLDAATAGVLEQKLMSTIDAGGRHLILNCAALSYVSSAGLRVLLMAAKKLKPLKGQIVLSVLQPHIREVFDIAGFSAIFPIHDTDEAAIRALQGLPT
jgi:anti-sigma B factor antagonist